MKTILAFAAALALSGCVSAPNVDWSHTDRQCSSRCSSEYSSCTSGFKLFPLAAQSSCNESLKVCAASCGASIAAQ